MLTGYLAPEGFAHVLEKELNSFQQRIGSLYLKEGPLQRPFFVENIWYDVEEIEFCSIAQAAERLREKNALWSHYPVHFIRKAALIEQRLPFFRPKKIHFPLAHLPKANLGAFVMLGENRLYAAPRTLSPFAHGRPLFHETSVPPSRAYLKLWEALTLIGSYPQPGQRCLEVGASPGSWTWALQQMGAHVIAVDRAPLAPHIAALSNIEFIKRDAFSLLPKDFPDVQWLFCDVICYPERLLEWLYLWIQERGDLNFVCTIKFQGENDYRIAHQFLSIPGSQVFHLHHNKNELTWILMQRKLSS